MSQAKVQCPRCGQAWLMSVRLVHVGIDAVWCPECDALWSGTNEIGPTNFHDYGTFMIKHGRSQPEAQGELLIQGPLQKD